MTRRERWRYFWHWQRIDGEMTAAHEGWMHDPDRDGPTPLCKWCRMGAFRHSG